MSLFYINALPLKILKENSGEKKKQTQVLKEL